MNGQEHFYLETQAALAWVDESGRPVRALVDAAPDARCRRSSRACSACARHEVIVQCLRMGGAFGGKETQANAWAAVAALGARKLRRPVRVRLTRAQDMTMTGKRHPFLARFDVGFDGDGQAARRSRSSSSATAAGAWTSARRCWRARCSTSTTATSCPTSRSSGRVCRTHHVSHTAFRGFGGPQGMVVDRGDPRPRRAHAGAAAGRRARAQLLRARATTTHYGQEVRDADRIARIWSELQDQRRLRRAPARDRRVQRAQPAQRSAAWRSRR